MNQCPRRLTKLCHVTTSHQWAAVQRGVPLEPRSPDTGPQRDATGIYTFELEAFKAGWNGWGYKLLRYLQAKAERVSASLVLLEIDLASLGPGHIRVRENMMSIDATDPVILHRELQGIPLETCRHNGLTFSAPEYIIQRAVAPPAITCLAHLPKIPRIESSAEQTDWLKATLDALLVR